MAELNASQSRSRGAARDECNRASGFEPGCGGHVAEGGRERGRERERTRVQSRNEALSKGALKAVGGKKQRLRCVPVSHPGRAPGRDRTFHAAEEPPAREKPTRLGFDIVLDNPYSILIPSSRHSHESSFPSFPSPATSHRLIPIPRDDFRLSKLRGILFCTREVAYRGR